MFFCFVIIVIGCFLVYYEFSFKLCFFCLNDPKDSGSWEVLGGVSKSARFFNTVGAIDPRALAHTRQEEIIQEMA